MDIAARTIIAVMVFILVFGIGVIWLQLFLSKQENKWLGLILPGISLLFSLIAALGVLLYTAYTGTQTVIVNGEIVETVTQITSMSAIIGAAVYVFLLYNIPTAILTAIYVACRGKQNRQRALEKMSAQDL